MSQLDAAGHDSADHFYHMGKMVPIGSINKKGRFYFWKWRGAGRRGGEGEERLLRHLRCLAMTGG